MVDDLPPIQRIEVMQDIPSCGLTLKTLPPWEKTRENGKQKMASKQCNTATDSEYLDDVVEDARNHFTSAVRPLSPNSITVDSICSGDTIDSGNSISPPTPADTCLACLYLSTVNVALVELNASMDATTLLEDATLQDFTIMRDETHLRDDFL
jgi:hypothetical protein